MSTTTGHATQTTRKAPSRTPILITEQEVALSTVAASQAKPSTVGWWTRATSGVMTTMRRMISTSTPTDRRKRGDCPRRYSYLEYACMSREMDRL